MSFEMNKIFGALLGAMILAMATGIIAGQLVHPTELAKPAYMVAGVEGSHAPARRRRARRAGADRPLLASASAANGKDITNRLCVACHTFNKGEPTESVPTSTASSTSRSRGPRQLFLLLGAAGARQAEMDAGQCSTSGSPIRRISRTAPR